MITIRSHVHRPSIRLLSLIIMGGAASTLLLTGTPAYAAAPTGSEAASSQSCWENVDTGETGCFDTALDAHEQIEIATGLPLVAVATGDESKLGFSSRATTPAAVNYLLVTGYDGVNKTGDSKSYFTSNTTGCAAGLNYSFQNLQTWSDRFESIQSFNGCLTTLYTDINFGGTFTNPIATSNDLGAFKNTASSLDAG